jgi:hypothetical protein
MISSLFPSSKKEQFLLHSCPLCVEMLTFSFTLNRSFLARAHRHLRDGSHSWRDVEGGRQVRRVLGSDGVLSEKLGRHCQGQIKTISASDCGKNLLSGKNDLYFVINCCRVGFGLTLSGRIRLIFKKKIIFLAYVLTLSWLISIL